MKGQGLGLGGAAQVEDLVRDAARQHGLQPRGQVVEVSAHFLRDLGRDGRHLGSQHRADAERRRAVADAGRPVAHVGVQLRQRVGDLPLEGGHAGARSFAVADDDRAHQFGLAGEMMVDAGLADPHGFRDVGIAEAVVAAHGEQRLRAGDDLAGFRGEFHVHGTQSTN